WYRANAAGSKDSSPGFAWFVQRTPEPLTKKKPATLSGPPAHKTKTTSGLFYLIRLFDLIRGVEDYFIFGFQAAEYFGGVAAGEALLNINQVGFAAAVLYNVFMLG